MRIITESKLHKMLNEATEEVAKEVYKLGLNIGFDIGYQTRKMDESHQGTILKGYDIEKDLEEILERKGWE